MPTDIDPFAPHDDAPATKPDTAADADSGEQDTPPAKKTAAKKTAAKKD